MTARLAHLDGETFAYLTTTGRISGRAHRIEIWFARAGRALYLLSGGGSRADWVANLRADPHVRVEVGSLATTATARIVTDVDEDELARRLLFDKYQPGHAGDLTDWRVPRGRWLSTCPDRPSNRRGASILATSKWGS